MKIMYTEKDIETAIKNLIGKAPIVRQFGQFIILAQNEGDYNSKCADISRGNTLGFFTIERALLENNK